MAINIGAHSILINPRHKRKRRDISAEGIKQAEECLDGLADILDGDFEWVLTGGMSIAATIGRFYREHGDIDVGIHEKDLGQLAEAAGRKGYGLFSRRIMAKLSPSHKLDIYRSVSPEEALENRCKNLRMVRTDSRGSMVKHNKLLDYFDVYVHRCVDGKIVCDDEGITVPVSHNLGGVYTTLSGKQIRLRNMEYIEQLKMADNDEVDRYDLGILRRMKERICLG